ncbi:hypothetical protein Bbelb_426120 [Branchiostoma belcheri]|nr:hypothetical protein Bbelb_426120 [Branchiostoma belcheri]
MVTRLRPVSPRPPFYRTPRVDPSLPGAPTSRRVSAPDVDLARRPLRESRWLPDGYLKTPRNGPTVMSMLSSIPDILAPGCDVTLTPPPLPTNTAGPSRFPGCGSSAGRMKPKTRFERAGETDSECYRMSGERWGRIPVATPTEPSNQSRPFGNSTKFNSVSVDTVPRSCRHTDGLPSHPLPNDPPVNIRPGWKSKSESTLSPAVAGSYRELPAGRAADNYSESRRSLGNQDLAGHLPEVALTGTLQPGTGVERGDWSVRLLPCERQVGSTTICFFCQSLDGFPRLGHDLSMTLPLAVQ